MLFRFEQRSDPDKKRLGRADKAFVGVCLLATLAAALSVYRPIRAHAVPENGTYVCIILADGHLYACIEHGTPKLLNWYLTRGRPSWSSSGFWLAWREQNTELSKSYSARRSELGFPLWFPPLLVLLLGLALNAGRFFKRKSRFKNGQCVSCGYVVGAGESAVCPECGRPTDRMPKFSLPHPLVLAGVCVSMLFSVIPLAL